MRFLRIELLICNSFINNFSLILSISDVFDTNKISQYKYKSGIFIFVKMENKWNFIYLDMAKIKGLIFSVILVFSSVRLNNDYDASLF